MRKRLIEFQLLSLFFLSIAVSIPFQVMIQYGHWPHEVMAIYSKLTPLNLAVAGLGLLCAAVTYVGSPLVVITSPVFLLVVTLNNLAFLRVEANYSPLTAAAGIAIVFLVHLLLVRREPREVIRNPQLRWWRTPLRRQVSLLTYLHPVTGGGFCARTYDLSTTGAFIDERTVKWIVPSGTTVPNEIRIGVRCALKIYLDPDRLLNCSCEIVRRADARGDHPAGFAIHFVDLTRAEKTLLEDFLRQTAPPSKDSDSDSDDVLAA